MTPDDIVQRLRAGHSEAFPWHVLCMQAADEIESLRTENGDMARHLAEGIAIIQQLQKREGGT